MTLLFNALASAVLIATFWLAFNSAAVPTAPQRALVAAVSKAGLVHTGTQGLVAGEQLLSFSERDCPAPVELLYLPSVVQVSPFARQMVDAGGRRPFVIYDGAAVGGIGFQNIFGRWLWRKLVLTTGWVPRDPWSSVLIVVLVPADCKAPAVDWAQFGPKDLKP